ncbi:hypothetical protein P43SY_001425 [Pythium insidiosum]|uniref:Uncharacterized protein n=1 Tax=Pythium insidiosum TaxID=114742 RepID=A0AAD5LQY5_PYTIN|nr:hypothetical protein P43SY_001425 [Pythium insidiosum]
MDSMPAMSKVQPLRRRRYCVCGRLCSPDSAATSNQHNVPQDDDPLHATAASPEALGAAQFPIPAPAPAPSTSTPAATDALSVLQLKVRALERYKTNYELLCSQLAELNTQVGLQLQRHEVDVSTLEQTIAALQQQNATLSRELQDAQTQLQQRQQVSEHSDRVAQQLATAAELLTTSEKRLQEHEQELQQELRAVQTALESARRDAEQLRETNAALGDALERAQEELSAEAKGHDAAMKRLRRQHKSERQQRETELDAARDASETLRASLRQLKKQVKQIREERDVLTKQVAHAHGNATHLTAVIESQRAEMQRQETKLQRWRRAHQEAQRELSEVKQELAETGAQLLAAKEALVERNARVEALTTELRTATTAAETHANRERQLSEEIASLRQQLEECSAANEQLQSALKQATREDQDREALELQRRCRKELQQVRQLLSLNHQRTTESTRDMKVLKHELSSVQQLLRKCQQTSSSSRTASKQKAASSYDDLLSDSAAEGDAVEDRETAERRPEGDAVEDRETAERRRRLRQQQLLRHRADVEKAVLQTAIMEQVEHSAVR